MPVQHTYRLKHLTLAIALAIGCAEISLAETLADASPTDLITRLDAFISRDDIHRTSINKAGDWNALALDERDDLVSVVNKGLSKKTVAGGAGTNVLQLNGAGVGSFADTGNFHMLEVKKGRWTAAGEGDFEDGVVVRSGATLINDGHIKGGAVTQGSLINSGAMDGHVFVDQTGTFSGRGTVGSLDVHGQLVVNRSAGAPTVKGDMHLSSTAVLAYEVNPDGRGETINVDGSANLGQATLNIVAAGEFPQTSRYTVIEAKKIEGEFSKILHDLAFMDATAQYNNESVDLIYARNDVPVENLATSGNAAEFGKSITEPEILPPVQIPPVTTAAMPAPTAPPATAGVAAPAAQPTTTASPAATVQKTATTTNVAVTALLASNKATASMALEQLAGSSNANLAKATLSSVDPVTGSLLSAMRQLDSAHGSNPLRNAPRLAAGNKDNGRIWVQALGHGGKLDRDVEPLQHSTKGLLIGADWSIDEEWRLGVMGGKSRTGLDSRELDGGLDSWHLGAYALRQSGPIALRLGATYSNHNGHTARQVAFTGFRDRPEGRYDASTQQAFGEIGYNLGSANISIEPFASLGIQRYQRDAYTEKGGAASLKVNEQAKTNMNSTLGLRMAKVDTLSNGMRLMPRFSAGWKHTYGDVFTKTSQRLVTGGRDYTVYGVELDRNSLLVDAGLDLGVSIHHSVGVGLTSEIGSDSRNHGLMGQWRMAF
ncbi:autotransporter outer membrane beta-barrel domain-containing protein [Pseudomonas sp. GB2N2]